MNRYRLPLGGLHGRTELTTVSRLIGSRLSARAGRIGWQPTTLVERAHAVAHATGQLRTFHEVAVGPRTGWHDTGIRLRRGQSVTVLADGRLWAARILGIGMSAKVALWWRVGTGPVVSMLGTAMVVTAETEGMLRVCAAEPGVLDESGRTDPAVVRILLSGSYTAGIIRWTGDPTTALTAAAHIDAQLFGSALIRIQNPPATPSGWHHHPRVGAAEVFTEQHHGTGSSAINCFTHADAAILCLPADAALTEGLTLSWSWQVDTLPSLLAENTEPTHDYLSVAVEFDDGRDLSWMWSSQLPVGTVFTCPLAYWRDRETHLVIRSGRKQLGQWITEHRNIAEDTRAALAPPYPQRVVAIWLIANSAIQNRFGSCRYHTPHLHTDLTEARP